MVLRPAPSSARWFSIRSSVSTRDSRRTRTGRKTLRTLTVSERRGKRRVVSPWSGSGPTGASGSFCSCTITIRTPRMRLPSRSHRDSGRPLCRRNRLHRPRLGRVIERLKALGLYESTLIVITSDHGEMLGEHGELDHTYFIYQSAIRIPLIFKLPGSKVGRRIDDPVGIVDIVPTVCSMLGVEAPDPVQGRDLSETFDGRRAARRGEASLLRKSARDEVWRQSLAGRGDRSVEVHTDYPARDVRSDR